MNKQYPSKQQRDVPPDKGVCERCVRELFDPTGRRFMYPFINCPECGPGYTIATLSPFDRELTSMSHFDVCPDCTSETTTPQDRRFQSQTNSCAKCGPLLALLDDTGTSTFSKDPIKDTIAHLKMGRIAAVKVAGGFHLVCDGTNEASVSKLRKRCAGGTHRIHIAVPSISALEKYCTVSQNEKSMISGKERPVVLMNINNNHTLAPSLVLDDRHPGFLLPQTPVHYLLFGSGLNDTRNYFFSDSYQKNHFHFEALAVADSSVYMKFGTGPVAEPELIKMLTGAAELFLTHNRKDAWPCELSVMREVECVSHPDGTPASLILSRSKGFLPAPVPYLKGVLPSILACGTDHNNSFCIAKGNNIVAGPLLRELDKVESLVIYRDTIDHFMTILKVNPEYVVVDHNPLLHSTRYGKNLKKECIEADHRQAHIASVIAEQSLDGDLIGIVLDRSEPDANGELAGSDIFRVSDGSFEREGRFKPYRLPGIAHSKRQPWRTAAGLLYDVFGDNFLEILPDFSRRIDAESAQSVKEMIDTENDAPLTSGGSCFLESLASLLDLKYVTAFEGEASRHLADIADKEEEGHYSFSISQAGIIDFSPMIREAVKEISPPMAPTISAKFQNTIAKALVESCLNIKKTSGTNRVVLAGEVFQNTHLLCRLSLSLQKKGFTVFLPRQFPIHDGGIAPGQLAIALSKIDKS